MDMWCLYGIGRASWDREVAMLVDPDPSPLKGEISLSGVFPLAVVSWSATRELLLLLLMLQVFDRCCSLSFALACCSAVAYVCLVSLDAALS